MPTIQKQTMKPAKKKTGSALDRIAPIHFDEDAGLKLLVYGRSGTGKTTLWSTFPGPILAMICSSGTEAGELRSVAKADYKKISQITIKSSMDLREIVAHQRETGQYKTLVLDHVTGFQDKVLSEILELDELPAQKAWGMASQQQYGQCTLQCKEHFRDMLNLDCNIVFVAQEREFNADTENRDLLTPYVAAGLTPSLVGWLNPAVDYICQTLIRPKYITKEIKIAGKTKKTEVAVKGQVEYCLRVAPHETYTTKFRIQRGRELPEFIVDANYEKIMELIN